MAKTPKHFLSRRAFPHMFAIIISWLVFIPAIYSPHGPACPARAGGLLGNDRGAVGVVFTIYVATGPGRISRRDTLRLPCIWVMHFRQCDINRKRLAYFGNLCQTFRKTQIDSTAQGDRPCSSWTRSCHSDLSNVLVCVICYKWRTDFKGFFPTTVSFWGAAFRIPGHSKEWWNWSSSWLILILETHGHAD